MTIKGYLDTASYAQVWPLVELPIEDARFVAPIDELIGETFQKFMDVRMESLFRGAEISGRLWDTLGVRIDIGRDMRGDRLYFYDHGRPER